MDVTCFRTIVEHNNLLVDPKITVLLGANESGKTNLLQAIDKFSLGNNFEENDISKMAGRRWRTKKFPNVALIFSLSEKEISEVQSFISDKDVINNITINKFSNDATGYSISISKKNQMDRINKELNSLERRKSVLQDRLVKLTSRREEVVKRLARLKKPSTIKKYEDERMSLDAEINNTTRLLEENKTQIDNLEKLKKTIKQKDISLSQEQINFLHNIIPKIKYVSNIELIPSTIPVSEIIAQNTHRSIAVGNLLKIGDIEDFNILNENLSRVRIHLRTASRLISEKLSTFWMQEPIIIVLFKEGQNLNIEFQEKISVSAPPEERSEGFQWFVSFLAHFVIDANDDSNTILLLDEPALKLHPKGQKDFIKILEEISSRCQIIYTSHSPFLVNKNYPHRIRVLRKEENGTKIINSPYSEGKTRFWEPLKTAIGISLGDLFSFGETNLIVEGISDQILLSAISHQLAKIEKPHLDLDKISIYPAEGASNVIYMGKFALSNKLNPIALLDSDENGKKAKSRAEEKKIPLKILMISEFKEDAFTIEDLLPRDKYIEAVNSSYSNSLFSEYIKIDENLLSKINWNDVGVAKVVCDHLEKYGYDMNKMMIIKHFITDLIINEKNVEEYESFIILFNRINYEIN